VYTARKNLWCAIRSVARFFDRYLRYFARFGTVAKAWNRYNYPGLGIAGGVDLRIEGEFVFGGGCSIGEGSNILIPKPSYFVLGDHCYVGRYVEICPGGRITIGTDTSIQDRCILLGNIAIGRHCLFGPNVMVSSGHHNFGIHPAWLIRDQDRLVSRDSHLSDLRNEPVVIEDDCWLGINTVVMPGVTIGKGAVVGANAVVVRDVDPYTVVGGIPARTIKRRLEFSPPPRINYADPHDLPYFYSGFEVSQKSLQEHSALGGIAAHKEFEICLDASSGGSIHLVARSMGDRGCELIAGDQRAAVATEFREVVFENRHGPDGALRFAARVSPATTTVLIKEAWVNPSA
jgi:acetyltransferase-like isoleucine patch superfamily enzyme